MRDSERTDDTADHAHGCASIAAAQIGTALDDMRNDRLDDAAERLADAVYRATRALSHLPGSHRELESIATDTRIVSAMATARQRADELHADRIKLERDS